MRRTFALTVSVAALVLAAAPGASASTPLQQRVLSLLRSPDALSQGAKAWLLGPQVPTGDAAGPFANPHFGTNVDANDPQRDLGSGQSETAIGATAGGRVVDAWNDASTFMFRDSTDPRASGTGVGYSADGARSFNDLIGLRNGNPMQLWSGDPAVAAIDERHFAVASLYLPSVDACTEPGQRAQLGVAVEILTIAPNGRDVSFGHPVHVSSAGNACTLLGSSLPPANVSLLDKDAISYDPSTRTLALSYTRFFLLTPPFGPHSGLGQIELARAHVPADPARLNARSFTRPVVVWPEEPLCPAGVISSERARCGAESEGAYVAFAPGGTAYVAWERNVDTNLGVSGDPYVYIHAARVPAGAAGPRPGGASQPVVVSVGQPNSNRDGGVRSLDSTVIAGYNRGIGNDFPRVAYDAPAGRLLVEWNDATLHPLGDIWLRAVSPDLSGLGATQRVNDDADYTLHFLPAVSVRADGTICSSWYDRRLFAPDSAFTDVFGECRAAPAAPGADFRITTGPTNWTNTSSLIVPNFGDYTDNASAGGTTYFTWSDGRLGVPQPFVDSR